MPQVVDNDEVVKGSRARRGEVPVVETETDGGLEVALAEQVARPTRPIVRVKAAYLGSDVHRSHSQPGKIMAEKIGDKEMKSIADSGNTSYDFRMYDAAGDVIAERLVADTHPVLEARGRIWAWVEHPDHAYAMATYRNKETKRPEFKLLGNPKDMALLNAYFARVNQSKREKQKEIVEVTG